eukprot:scaffold6888_cov96-Cylindrotheca_fusiformis.AAC.2
MRNTGSGYYTPRAEHCVPPNVSTIFSTGSFLTLTVERITTLCCQLTAASTAQTAKGLTIM